VGFVLSEDPPTVRAPDLAFIAASRIPAEGGRTGFARVVPDLVIEIISPSNTAAEIRARVYDYLDAGTRLVWALEPGARRVTVYSSAEEIRVLGERDELDGGEVLPGFRVEVLEVFKR
jgi:Uma2 family endonuclease